ncbi:MAG: sulfatase-like hydrolase/transferase [Candidatus Binatia bacterium]
MRFLCAVLAAALLASPAQAKPVHQKQAVKKAATPNILFVIMDDVGIDQMEVFGYGGATPPSTPNIAEIADEGVRFRNTWSMPACTTSRGALFSGRFPFRTDVLGALGPDDLANSMTSPYELTAPKLLKQKGYQSGMFGKFHITLQDHDPAGLAGPHALGWDFFSGWMDTTGDPSSIDLTAGGVAAPGKSYSCGFVPSKKAGGADTGACYLPDGWCRKFKTKSDGTPPGRTCRDMGGIFDPEKKCRKQVPDYIDFEKMSGHYVSPLVYNFPNGSVQEVPATDPRSRRFRAKVVVDEAVEWIRSRPKGTPWMATVSFASDHTPLMHPPATDDLAGNAATSDLDCSNLAVQRELSNLMIASMDKEIGRLLVETKLARRTENGKLTYDPARTDTMVVVLGDNGSLAQTVKQPFSVPRAKGTAYQTGVWVPLVVSGPMVEGPGRAIPHMVNSTDLYSLFGEVAGIEDVAGQVPRPVDAKPMLPYLVDPQQPGIRPWNFTQVGTNLQANGAINGPCTISDSCTQIPVTKGVCEDNNGTWWGKKHDAEITQGAPEEGFQRCCQVNEFVLSRGCDPTKDGCPYTVTPLTSLGIRNEGYKIVENVWQDYVSPAEPCKENKTVEFFEVDEAAPMPHLDDPGEELPLDALTPEQQQNYDELSAALEALLATDIECPGDGNIDLVVDQKDLDDWSYYNQLTGLSSVYDLDIDGDTDADDRAIIEAHLGTDCRLP